VIIFVCQNDVENAGASGFYWFPVTKAVNYTILSRMKPDSVQHNDAIYLDLASVGFDPCRVDSSYRQGFA
jgi:hypothetical protein